MEKWVDVTTNLKTAVLSLELGQLVHDNAFGLYEAMSAIEIMEPKMDSGLIYTGNSRKILSFDSAIEENILILDNSIPLSKIVFIIDYTYASLIKWLEGSNFVQTLMINLYLHKPELISNQCLKICMLSILKISYFIRDILTECGNHEEEEFLAYTYDFDLSLSYKYQDLLAELEKLIQNCLETEDKSEYSMAIKNRLELTYSLLMILGTYYDALQNSKMQSQINCFTHMNIHQNNSEGPDHSKFDNQKFCNNIQSEIKYALELIEKSYTEAKFYPDISGYSDDEETQLNQLLAHGFEPLVNMKLLPSTFPREVKFVKPSIAYSYIYHRVCEYVKLSLTLLEKPHTYSQDFNLFPNFLKFLKIFDGPLKNKDQIPKNMPSNPCLLARCLFQITYFQCLMKVPPCSALLTPNLTKLSQENYHDPHTSPAIAFDHFINQIKLSVACFSNNKLYDSYKKDEKLIAAFCENEENPEAFSTFIINASTVSLALINIQMLHPTKRRDKLPLILRDLAYMQQEAERLDEYKAAINYQSFTTVDQSCPKYNPYFSWLLYTTMLSYLLYGFDLQLYSHYELPYIYWYLSKIYTYLEAMFMIMDYSPSQPEVTAKNGYKCEYKNSHEDRVMDYKIFRILCQAYYKSTLAMSLDGQIEKPKYEFTTQKVRFEHRTSPLAALTSFRWSYEAFQAEQSRDSRGGVAALYRDAEQSFSEAAVRCIEATPSPGVRCPEPFPLDHVTGDHVIRRLCKGNTIACAAIRSRGSTCANRPPKMAALLFDADPRFTKLEYSKVHTYFPLIKILPQTSYS